MVLKNKKNILQIVCVLTCVFVLFFSVSPVKADAFGWQTNESGRTFAEFPLVYTGRVGGRSIYGMPFPTSYADGDVNSQYPIEYGFMSQGEAFPVLNFIFEAGGNTSRFAYRVYSMYPDDTSVFDRNANFVVPYPVLLSNDSQLSFIYPVAVTYEVVGTLWTYDQYSTTDAVVSDMSSQVYSFSYHAEAYEAVNVLSSIINPGGKWISNLQIYVSIPSGCDNFYVISSAKTDIQDGFSDFSGRLDFSYDLENNVTIVESEFPTSWTDWMIETVSGFFAFEIAPGLSFGVIFISIFGVLLLWFILHLFM